MKCPKCGKEVANDSVFCEYCGARLDEVNKNKTIWAVLTLLFVLCVGVGIWIVFNRGNHAEVTVAREDSTAVEIVGSTECVKYEPKQEMVKPLAQHQAESEKKKGTIIEEPKVPQGYVDLGLPSGTLWKAGNEIGFFSYDVARRKFGRQLPTSKQFEELISVCDASWIGSGYRFTGPNGNSIALPAAGLRDSEGNIDNVGISGHYWSSTPQDEETAWELDFDENYKDVASDDRCIGQSVRLVRK